jgi:hypothetical protein
MGKATAEHAGRYVADGGDADLRRLVTVSEVTAEAARRAFGRVGIRDGWTAIDCGCGPRERAVRLGIAAERIDEVLVTLRAAGNGQYEWVSAPFFLDLALRKPVVA